MRYRIGQRVRLLHDSGEGVITALVDAHTVEVDMGDDFPVDVSVKEIIPIDRAEHKFMGKKVDEKEEKVQRRNSFTSSIGVYSPTFAISKIQGGFALYILNPGPSEILYTFYVNGKKHYSGLASGKIEVGDHSQLAKIRADDFQNVKGFYIQILLFASGKGHPQVPIVTEIPWNKGRIGEPMRELKALNTKAWLFSLTEEANAVDTRMRVEGEISRIKKADVKSKPEMVVDLHIEQLTSKSWAMSPVEMLDTQLRAMEEAVSKAMLDNYESLVLIHGVGEGVLRKEILSRLQPLSYVKEIEAADPKRFGNGASRVVFK